MGDEDWYYLLENEETGEKLIEHSWSHRISGEFISGTREYSIDEFEEKKPNQYSKLIEWQNPSKP
jgi:hypothetical protein